MRWALRLLLYTVIVIIFTAAALTYLALRPARITSEVTPADLGLEYESVQFETEDGVELAGWMVPRQDDGETAAIEESPTIMALHGYPADKGNILPAVADLSQDYNLFLFDFRYHGESGGAYSGLGAKETQDLQAAATFIDSEYDIDSFGIWGFSFGASVALLTAPEEPAIRAIYAESSYADLHRLARETLTVPVVGSVLAETASVMARPFGVDTRATVPAAAASELDIPVQIVHSTEDEVIDISHGRELYAALESDSATLREQDGGHGQLQPDYLEQVRDFFDEHLTGE